MTLQVFELHNRLHGQQQQIQGIFPDCRPYGMLIVSQFDSCNPLP